MGKQTELATLGGGCFWCLEAVFELVEGVESVVSGYSGGEVPNPTYEQVYSGETGHAEVVQIRFDPDTITYHELLGVFFSIHDPTTRNRQGNDVGTQYRSVIFTHDETQEQTAHQAIAELSAGDNQGEPIVTQVVPCETFYPAEDYHHEYFRLHGTYLYCRTVIAPKVAKFRTEFTVRLK